MQSSTLLDAIEECIKEYQEIIGDQKKSDIPQADDLDKIIEIPLLVSQGVDTDYKMARHFQFSKRQSSYYRKAAEILGLVGTNRTRYYLTDVGQKYVQLSAKIQKKYFTKLLLEFPVIHQLFFNLSADRNKPVTKNEIAEILKENSYLTGQTLTRRAQTIFKWVEWIQYNGDLK
jgi:hypothetical protein